MLLERIKENKWKIIIGLIVVLVIGWFIWDRYTLEARLKKAETLTAEQAKKAEEVEKALSMEKEQSKQLVKAFQEAMNGQRQPSTTYVYNSTTAKNNDEAAGEIKDKINNKDSSLPPDALLESDRTAVVAGEAGNSYDVGIFKVWTAPKTLKGPAIGWNPTTDGTRPTSAGYVYLRNVRSTDKPPSYWGAMVEAGRQDGSNEISVKIMNLK